MRKGPPINVSNFGKGKISEDMENLNEKNVPTNPELWSRAKSLARSKFDVYPSAYANGWASKWYKGKGGGWRSVSEETSSKLSVSKADVVSVQGVAEGTSTKLSAAPIKIGSIYRMKVNGSQTYGKVASINDDRGTVRLRRLNKDGSPYEGTGPDKDSHGRWIHQYHFHVTYPDKLVKRFQMDNMYGELVPYGTAKIPGKEPIGEDKRPEETERLSFKDFIAERCWPGYKEVKGKKAFAPGSCVKESAAAAIAAATAIAKKKSGNYDEKGFRKTPYKNPDSPNIKTNAERKKEMEESAAWQRKEGKNPEGGLNRKGIESYRRENPGSKLSMAVTTPPSKLKPGSKAANRRKSFCARMGGMEGPMKKPNGEPTRKALSLRKWNC